MTRISLEKATIMSILMVMAFCAGRSQANDSDENAKPTQVVVIADASTVGLQMALQDKVVFHGLFNMDKAGGPQGAMLYPAPGLAGLAVAVITHAIVNSSIRDREKTALEEKADEVLLPYRTSLNGYLNRELFERSKIKATNDVVRRAHPVVEGSTTDWVVSSSPVFFMTQDQHALILDNRISVFARGDMKNPVYINTVRVISALINEAGIDIASYWGGGNAEHFKEESAKLLAESFDIVVVDLARNRTATGQYQTVRYLEGDVEKMERSRILSETCSRLVVKTLRGWVLSVPRKDAGECVPSVEPAKV